MGILGGLIFGLLIGGAAAFVGVAIFDVYGLAVGIAVFLLILLLPVVESVKSFRAWAAF
jgi:hypothetical protein